MDGAPNYGRRSRLAVRVNPDGSAGEFGDEPLLIAREAGVPVYVAPRRYDAGLLAEADQAFTDEAVELVGRGFSPGIEPAESTRALAPKVCLHLLDDGFQHRQLARDVDILLLDRKDWRDRLLPAGNLREPLKAARRANVIAIPANEPELEAELRTWGWQGPVWRLRRKMEVPAVDGPVAAFCGIARPDQFFQGLEAAGLRLAARTAFPDHFAYTRGVLEDLLTKARAAEATALVTTEKDLVRLGKLASNFPKTMPPLTARLTIEIENQATAINWLIDQLAPCPPHLPL